MKKISVSTAYRSLLLFLFACMQVLVWGQDTTITSRTTVTTESTSTSDWYTQPWVWVVGGAVLIVILVALLRKGPSRDKEVRTTVIKDNRGY